MEKVQVISVKPICASNEESLYASQTSDSKSAGSEYSKGVENANSSLQKGTALGYRASSAGVTNTGLNINGNAQTLKKDSYNSSFKKVVPWSQKDKNFVSERFNHYKSGFPFPVSSTNCFGRSDFRASYNERIRSGPTSLQHFSGYRKEKKVELEAGNDFVYLTGNAVVGNGLYRSNSSLELDHDVVDDSTKSSHYLKREYGSHGSINVTAVQQEALYSVLQSYQEDSKSQDIGQLPDASSPKVLSKIHRLWEKDRSSIFKKFLPGKTVDVSSKSDKIDVSSEVNSNAGGTVISNSNAKHSTELMESENKEEIPIMKPIRRSAIAHYDCQSLAAQLSSARLKSLLADRSNTTTGASAAAMADSGSLQNSASHSSTEELSLDDVDYGDGRSNHLVSSCPFFQNEIGGEGERIVSLSREIIRPVRSSNSNLKPINLHRSTSASSIGLLEPISGSSFWSQTLCPYVKKTPILETVDQGSSFFAAYFKSQEHQNWFGVDDSLGPVAISIKKEKVEENNLDKNHGLPSYQYRFIFRTSELFTCQGTIREENLNQRSDKSKGQGIREAIEYICPQLTLNCLRLGIASPETEEILIKLDELGIHRKFKVGVLYCRAGQKTEEDMYNNENSGPAFSEFLEILGQRVRLKNFDKYRGGLDKNTDSTGHYSVYTQYQGCEIMFHVSTLLPFTPTNKKQLLRKRHIGNDIVTIVFQEPGALPFTPKNIRSHFQHVFIVVQAINPCTDSTCYSIGVSRFQDVPTFGPPIPDNATFPKSKKFVDFLLAKVINGELAALRSDKFACMAARTKHEYLKDLALNRITTATLDTSSKFSIMGFSRASKKEKSRFKFVADSTVKGALSWNMTIYDATLQQNVDCVLAISIDSLVVLEIPSSSVIFSTSCRSILGWTTKPRQGLHVFYHQGECLIFNLCQRTSDSEGEEILNDIVTRLSAVTQGAESQEMVLRRNPAGLLGFNVQQDGIITEVEPFGLAAQARLQQGSRLVEICTVALATLSQEQMVDLLKTSMTVTVTVIPPHVDGTPRRGCNVPTCTFLLGCSEGDYENLTPPEQGSASHTKNRIKQLNRCDRSLSPPRSGSSSGYGTGSSSHSFSLDQTNKAQSVIQETNFSTHESTLTKDKFSVSAAPDSGTFKFSEYAGTLSSTSSGHSNDRWSETNADESTVNKASASQYSTSTYFHSQRQSPFSQSDRDYSPPPPPLPVRLYQHKKEVTTNYHVPSSVEQGSDGSKSPYNRRLHHTMNNNQIPCYEQSNYAVPKAIPRPVSKDLTEVKKFNKNVENHYEYENSRYTARIEGTPSGNGKQNNFRRNSSPLALESKEFGHERDDAKKSDAMLRTARHSVPKTMEDHLSGCRSEDELSVSSGSSPHGFQKSRGTGGSNSSPSLSSRNQSPHNFNPNAHGSKGDNAPTSTVRLKHSVQNSKNIQNRNSASLGSTNLQEELLKLINPDYLSDSESMGAEIREKKEMNVNKINSFPTYDEDESVKNINSQQLSQNSRQPYPNSGEKSSTNTGIYDCLPTPYQTIGEAEFTSRKNVFAARTSGERLTQETAFRKPQTSEGLLLTARPATVISNASTASSPAYMEAKEKQSNGEMALDTRKTKETSHTSGVVVRSSSSDEVSETNRNLPHDNPSPNEASAQVPSSVIDKEWSSLVNTATLAIEKGSKTNVETQEDMNANPSSSPTPSDVMNTLSDEFHKYMPIYFEKFLADSKSSNPGQETSNDNTEAEDSNGNNPSITSLSSVVASLPPSVDDNTRLIVEQLERALVSEQRLSGKLKEEVAFLRNENSKLLKDSRAAAQQLHQFTEWFFNNIHKT